MKNHSQTPDFIGIGASKAASTWIFKCLKDHPEICGSSKKEISFFNKPYNYRKGIAYYKSFFKHCPKQSFKGEFTPNYINSPHVPVLIYKHFPDIKIIACLRNPIDKIYSDYKFNKLFKQRFSIYKNFETAIKKNPVLLRLGYYHKQLEKFIDLFPRDQILILIYDDLRKDPKDFIKKIYEFIGVTNIDFIPPSIESKSNVTGSAVIEYKIPILNSIIIKLRAFIDQISWLNILVEKLRIETFGEKVIIFNKKTIMSNKEKKESIPMKIETREYLYNVYKDDIRKLEKLLNRDLNFWK